MGWFTMIEILNLITQTYDPTDPTYSTFLTTKRQVFGGVRSIGQSEFYQAQTTNLKPELKFVLADYLEYQGETLAEYNGIRYSILRTYRSGNELELVLTRASEEEGGGGYD